MMESDVKHTKKRDVTSSQYGKRKNSPGKTAQLQII